MLQFQVDNQTLTLTESQRLIEGARDFVRFQVNFSPEWEGYFVMMRFFRENEEAYEVADVRAGQDYYLPHGVLARPGAFYVACLGVRGEHSLATTSRLRLDVEASDIPEEAKPVTEASPTLLSEVVRLLTETGKNLSLAPLSFSKNETHLLWKYASEDEGAYREFLPLSAITGKDGKDGKDGKNGDGIFFPEQADADFLTVPGIYCCTDQKINFPLALSSRVGSLYLFVQEILNSYGEKNTVQIVFGAQEDADGVSCYSRQRSPSFENGWSAWSQSIFLPSESVTARHLSSAVASPIRTRNLLDPLDETRTEGVYLLPDGKLRKEADYTTSGYIPVEAGTYVFKRFFTSPMIMTGAYYDQNKTFVSFFGEAAYSTQSAFEVEISAPGFVRLSYRGFDVYPHYHMFAKGTAETEFVPYNVGVQLFSSECVALGEGLCLDLEQTGVGRYNKYTRGARPYYTAFLVGNGTGEDARSNAFRVDYQGKTYAAGNYSSSGADYAEYFEWEDGGDRDDSRLGRLVALRGEKIVLAEEGDAILGVVSATPSVVGDAASEDWHGRYQRDVFGRILYGEDAEGRSCPILSREYDPARKYVPREERREWACVGLMGKLVATDDGTLSVGDFVTATKDGIAAKSAEKTSLVVLRRLDERHVRLFVK